MDGGMTLLPAANVLFNYLYASAGLKCDSRTVQPYTELLVVSCMTSAKRSQKCPLASVATQALRKSQSMPS